jgi:hypothetical protein
MTWARLLVRRSPRLRLLSSQAILACRSLLNRSSPALLTATVFRSPRNGLISHPQRESIRFRSRAEVPIWSTAVLSPKIRYYQRRTARLWVQKSPVFGPMPHLIDHSVAFRYSPDSRKRPFIPPIPHRSDDIEPSPTVFLATPQFRRMRRNTGLSPPICSLRPRIGPALPGRAAFPFPRSPTAFHG